MWAGGFETCFITWIVAFERVCPVPWWQVRPTGRSSLLKPAALLCMGCDSRGKGLLVKARSQSWEIKIYSVINELLQHGV